MAPTRAGATTPALAAAIVAPGPVVAGPAEAWRDAPAARRVLDRCRLPATYLADLDPSVVSPAAALRRALRHLPPSPSPPAGPGTVMVVVGEPRYATSVAVGLCAPLGVHDTDLVIVAPRGNGPTRVPVISRADVAVEERRSWRWRTGPTVVLVDARVDPRGDRWASRLLAALEPTVCWGVAEAFRKPEDLGAWSREMGGFDALALVAARSTTTPAAVLSLDIPIAEIDGRPADADLWFELLEPSLPAAKGST